VMEGRAKLPVQGTTSFEPASRTVIFTPSAPLRLATRYYVICGAENLQVSPNIIGK
jgi:hypothetical protein